MVYHEKRKLNGKIANYLVQNQRTGGKFKKKSKFIGYGKLSKRKINLVKEEFEKELKKDFSENLNETQINKIENLKKIYFEKIKKFDRENFDEVFFTELTYDSNAIEGSTLSLSDTSLVINDGLAPKGKTLREINEAKNHIEAIKFVKSYDGAMNEIFILKLHRIILKNISDRFAGVYRNRNVRIRGSDVKLPSHEKVPQLMKNLIYWYNQNKTRMHAFELAVVFSVKFVTIHPFVDGNGRVSRLLMNFILGKFGYPWINIRFRNRKKYLDAVRKGNDEKYESIIRFAIKQLEENMKVFETTNYKSNVSKNNLWI